MSVPLSLGLPEVPELETVWSCEASKLKPAVGLLEELPVTGEFPVLYFENTPVAPPATL